jgi:hypothetical protein
MGSIDIRGIERNLNIFLHSKKCFRVECGNIYYLHIQGIRKVDGSKMLEEKIEEFLKKTILFSQVVQEYFGSHRISRLGQK